MINELYIGYLAGFGLGIGIGSIAGSYFNQRKATLILQQHKQHYAQAIEKVRADSKTELQFFMASLSKRVDDEMKARVQAATTTAKERAAELGLAPNADVPKINALIERLTAISNEQKAMLQSIDCPSANGLHSKYKNNIIDQLKALDIEKRVGMQALIDMGCDPLVPYKNDKGDSEMIRLSEILKLITPQATPAETKIERKAKFTIIQGGDEPNKGGNDGKI
jgi:hypothetical protein